jgi:hypothetical protein
MDSEVRVPTLVTLQELSKQWNLPYSWLKEYSRTRCSDPIPVFRMGRYIRADLNDPALLSWLSRRKSGRKSP